MDNINRESIENDGRQLVGFSSYIIFFAFFSMAYFMAMGWVKLVSLSVILLFCSIIAVIMNVNLNSSILNPDRIVLLKSGQVKQEAEFLEDVVIFNIFNSVALSVFAIVFLISLIGKDPNVVQIIFRLAFVINLIAMGFFVTIYTSAKDRIVNFRKYNYIEDSSR